MELNINISTNEYCHVLIEDLSTYQDETDIKRIRPSKLKFSDTVSIIIPSIKPIIISGKVIGNNTIINKIAITINIIIFSPFL